MHRSESNTFAINLLNRNPSIVKAIYIFVIIQLIITTYASIHYAYHSCLSIRYTLFAITTLLLYILFITAKNQILQQFLKVSLTLLSLILTLLIISDMISVLNTKTLCNVSICHKSSLFQENINFIIAGLEKQNTQFCAELKESHGKQQQYSSNEDAIEREYLGMINFVWGMFCRIYDSLVMSKAGENCKNILTAAMLFLNYELIVLKILRIISVIVSIGLLTEVLLKLFSHVFNKDNHNNNNYQDMELSSNQLNNNNSIPLMEFYQMSSDHQKDQNDTAVYLDNQLDQPYQQFMNQHNNNNNNSEYHSSRNEQASSQSQLLSDQSRVRLQDEKKQQYQHPQQQAPRNQQNFLYEQQQLEYQQLYQQQQQQKRLSLL